MSRVALVVVTDGRVDYLDEAIESARVNLHGQIDSCHLINDEPDAENHLTGRYPDFKLVTHGVRAGMAGAVRSAWAAAKRSGASYVFHLEDDFTFDEPVSVDEMWRTLADELQLAQLVLKRQPWSDEEKTAGGIVEMHPADYTDRDGWLEHRRIFSLNPCLIPMPVIELAMPGENPDGVEREITDKCLAAGLTFGIWGAREDAPRCEHIGVLRSAGYHW